MASRDLADDMAGGDQGEVAMNVPKCSPSSLCSRNVSSSMCSCILYTSLF